MFYSVATYRKLLSHSPEAEDIFKQNKIFSQTTRLILILSELKIASFIY